MMVHRKARDTWPGEKRKKRSYRQVRNARTVANAGLVVNLQAPQTLAQTKRVIVIRAREAQLGAPLVQGHRALAVARAATAIFVASCL